MFKWQISMPREVVIGLGRWIPVDAHLLRLLMLMLTKTMNQLSGKTKEVPEAAEEFFHY
jgi:hypothetical protein